MTHRDGKIVFPCSWHWRSFYIVFRFKHYILILREMRFKENKRMKKTKDSKMGQEGESENTVGDVGKRCLLHV